MSEDDNMTQKSTMQKLKYIFTIASTLLLFGTDTASAQKIMHNPKAISQMLERIGGKGTSQRILTCLDKDLGKNGQETFVITSQNQKPYIKGSSLSALTTGIGWYLNHYAHINLSWNQLTQNLSHYPMPVPTQEEQHACNADYRYYLNYCTFGYSMTTWTWERWQKEIDWMALHGINMPLQIIGLEEVWRRVLRQYGYTDEEAKRFVAGPAFTAWWGMNNLEGWGGTLRDAWFERQTLLCRKIVSRQRELGMQPVLPGFSATVPSNFTQKNPDIPSESQGKWCYAFQRPFIMDPTSEKFPEVARIYYKALKEVMGTSKYYSMDPFHEGGSISSGKYNEGYRAIYDAMNDNCGQDTKWVIQQWQWGRHQAVCLNAVPAGRLIVLDLFSDGHAAFDAYKGYVPQEAVFCTIPNFGGRTGFMGRLQKTTSTYFNYKQQYKSIKGIGTAPEAIESVPIVYDMLFELPWMEQEPDVAQWVSEYVKARYGTYNADALRAWLGILGTAMNETTALQGPHESVMCGRPSLTIHSVSTWGGSHIFYERPLLVAAARDLLRAAETIGTTGSLGAQNMSYDLTDIVRQCLSDYSKQLLAEIKAAYEEGRQKTFEEKKELFLQLILDTDHLLGTNRMFRLGSWTETARKAAGEMKGCTEADLDWMELENARTLITTWGDFEHSEYGGLRDYSYRQWQGLLRDVYYPRWKYWFDHQMQAPKAGWFFSEWNWAHDLKGEWGASAKGTERKNPRTCYSPTPEGDTYTIAHEIIQKYFGR